VAQVLIAQEQEAWEKILTKALSREHNLHFWDHSELDKTLEEKLYDLAIIDKELDDNSGLKLLERIKELSPETKVIISSLSGQPEEVVNAMKMGADDFITKPFTQEKIRIVVNQILDNKGLKNEIDYLRRTQDTIYDLDQIIAKSSSMKRVIQVIKKVSKTDSTLLMTGETGTGKSFLAGTIHFNSIRRNKPFVKIFCANMPETLLDSEFFGHEKGSFTGANKTRIGRFEQANGGTVFLDEIGDISVSLQSKLLRVLEEKEFERLGGNKTIHANIRIMSATNRDLEEAVQKGDFRQDLYYRINVLQVMLPPLRERVEDIEDLAYYFLNKHCRAIHKTINEFSPEVLQLFKDYSWPGNIRQLSNTIERAILLAENEVIDEQHIILGKTPPPLTSEAKEQTQEVFSPARHLVEHEKKVIIDALEKCLWIQKDAADFLGISRRVLNYKIKKLGIKHPRWRKNI